MVTGHNKKNKDKSLMTIAIISVVALVWAFGMRWYYLGGQDQLTSVGGPFELVDHSGKLRTDKDFLGEYMLIYFGYTYCPDVCPVSLQAASDILDALPEGTAKRIQPIMISIDPERDTPEQMSTYVANFHPRTVGLTGTPEQILDISKAYAVIAEKSGDDENYLMDHTSMFFFIGPDGVYLDRFSSLADPNTLALKIKQLMEDDPT